MTATVTKGKIRDALRVKRFREWLDDIPPSRAFNQNDYQNCVIAQYLRFYFPSSHIRVFVDFVEVDGFDVPLIGAFERVSDLNGKKLVQDVREALAPVRRVRGGR